MRAVVEALEHPRVYELWQTLFADRKVRPLLAHNDVTRPRRVLDLGCGPGTNAKYFGSSDYLGVDINERYVRYARSRYGREFLTADLTAATFPAAGPYDFILVNSFLHHLSDGEVQVVLERVRGLLAEGGHVHMLELVLPASAGPARLLARWDRGKYARPVERWRELVSAYITVDVCEPYILGGLGIPLWEMVYLRGQHS